MKIMRRLFIVLGLCSTLMFSQGAFAAGYLFQDACSVPNTSSADQSATCTASPEQIQGQSGILAKVTKLIAIIAGISAVIMVIISGLFFVTAAGDPSKVTSARNSLIGAVVGLIIVLTATGILKFVLTKV